MNTQDDIRKRARIHLIAFVAILVLALLSAATVMSGETTRATVFIIAAVQVLIVLSQMMHAFKDGPWVRWTLGLCVVFVAALAGLSLLGLSDTIDGTEHVVVAPAEPSPDAAEEH